MMELTKEMLDKLRSIEGFPIGEDDDIIALSEPPYYTACPNPFIEDFIKEHGKLYDEETDDYKREPFAADVSEGKNDPIYNAHSYHTKVPHKAIMRYILHYTEPGDIVFDGFCGTGMTGVAAQMCGNPEADKEFKYKLEEEMPYIKWGERYAILNDLSPAATFIAYNYNTPVDIIEFEKEANRILNECEKELGWLYETAHVDKDGKQIFDMAGPVMGQINYTVWSDVFICPNCGSEIVFWDVAIDIKGKIRNEFKCSKCNCMLNKKDLTKKVEIVYDSKTEETFERPVQVPVLIVYTVANKRYEVKIKEFDLKVIGDINRFDGSNLKYPIDLMMFKEGRWGDIWRAGYHKGYFRSHHFYSKRNLIALSRLWEKINLINNNSIKKLSQFCFTGAILRLNKTNKYLPSLKMAPGPIMGMLYIPSLYPELNVFNGFRNKLKNVINYKLRNKGKHQKFLITTQSANMLGNHPSSSIDYIFTDPPFGDNIMYSESNFLWESWLRVFTNNNTEAIINKTQNKGLLEYQNIMIQCFEECYRILKPNRWMTVEFHNSKNAVWNAIQESLLRAGFIIADVRTLDKQQGSFKQVTTTSAVKQDLVISAYKPKESFKERFLEKAGTEESVWEFIREHLNKLPVVVQKDNLIEIVREREAYLLFDRMVAYHIMAGIAVPIDAADFYKGLEERFISRDGMYFLHDQINEYDNIRISTDVEPIQFFLFVNDEKTAIAWLYSQLQEPQTYAHIQPKFMREAKVAKHEKMPELGELLEENFLQNDEGKWYIPDMTKTGDLIKLREKRLLKEFDEYLEGKGKLRLFRTEALRLGFAKLWKNKDYKNIVKVGNRLPEAVIQEDDKLLMYYDIALSRME